MIVLTESSGRDRVVSVGRLGVSGYILKSRFDLADLFRRIESILKPAPTSADSKRPQGSQTLTGTQDTKATPPSGNEEQPQTLKEVKPILSRSEVQERLDACGELKGLSPTVTQVSQMTRSESCSIESIARVVRNDQAVALKILKLANSSAFKRDEPVESVERAVANIGMKRINETVTNIAVIERFGAEGAGDHLHILAFWEHAIACGLIASELMKRCGGNEDDVHSAFMMGLLHDVGRVIYTEVLGEDYLRVLETAKRLRLPLDQVESRMLLINHADAMDRILHAWNFPKTLINPIVFHHLSVGNIRRVAPGELRETAIVALSNRLAHAMLLGDSGNPVIQPTSEYAQALKLKPDTLDWIQENIPDQTQDLKLVMLNRGLNAHWPDPRQGLIDAIGTPLSPIFVGSEEHYDGLKLLCNRITTPADDQKPNIGIIHIEQARDRAVLTRQWLEQESSAGSELLPLVILSPNANIGLEDRAMKDRRVELVPSTITLDRLASVLRKVLQDEADGPEVSDDPIDSFRAA